MGLQLPTDTQHLALETRQYEIFGKSLGQGIPRRRIYIAAFACVLWWLFLAILAVHPLTKLGPTVYLLPPFLIVFFGTRLGDDGRMRLMRWYDAILAWAPARRRIIRNPLLPVHPGTQAVIRMSDCIVELHPDHHGDDVTSTQRAAQRPLRPRATYEDLVVGPSHVDSLAGDGR